jgi:hypothetical protein
MDAKTDIPRSRESGIALVIAVMLLIMVSAIGLASLQRSGEDKLISAGSRRQTMNLAAAEAGLRLVQDRLYEHAVNPNTLLASTLDEPNFIRDSSGLMTAVRSGGIGDDAPGPIERLDGSAQGTSGYELSAGRATGAGNRAIYRVSVTATDAGGGNAEVEAQFSVLEVGTSGY